MMETGEILMELTELARRRPEIRKALLETADSDRPLSELCRISKELGYPLYEMDLISAGEDYYGFNLIVEDDARMVLTYNGCAVATLTKIERETTAIINGESVTGTIPAYRTNTFPPELKEGMVTSDLEKILEASGRIKACTGNPEAVSAVMREYFTQGENVSKLRKAIDRKIQMKESSRRQKQDSAQRKTPKRILPR